MRSCCHAVHAAVQPVSGCGHGAGWGRNAQRTGSSPHVDVRPFRVPVLLLRHLQRVAAGPALQLPDAPPRVSRSTSRSSRPESAICFDSNPAKTDRMTMTNCLVPERVAGMRHTVRAGDEGTEFTLALGDQLPDWHTGRPTPEVR